MTTAITKESLTARIAELESGPRSLKEDYALAAYKMLLTTMEAEPVATLDVQSRRPDGNKFALVFSSTAHKLPDDVYFLYCHAQPAPVVPDELKEAAADFLTVLDEYPEQLVPINRDSAVVRALRAAMLAAAHQEKKP